MCYMCSLVKQVIFPCEKIQVIFTLVLLLKMDQLVFPVLKLMHMLPCTSRNTKDLFSVTFMG